MGATVLPARCTLTGPGILTSPDILTPLGPRAAPLTATLMAAGSAALAGPRIPGLGRSVTELALLLFLRRLLSLLLRDEADFQQLIAQ